ncbi:hypothetical protein [Mesorhizobium sp. B4-1-4]|uniref:hypothetical protein n=1 Tax=Mesorhizobium sp. B4-1-4 TaxID=2589888 RepID=UPI0015E2F5DC|nr:hypothetical protein [Mesorhizobium sp. B4-1-4]UCI31776.1 hypothetical protein FJW03_29150 [Mesorhizobium sp. B4-1-4]
MTGKTIATAAPYHGAIARLRQRAVRLLAAGQNVSVIGGFKAVGALQQSGLAAS